MPRDGLYLVEILDAADLIALWTDGIGDADWHSDELRRSAVLQKLTVIGEATRSVSAAVTEQHPAVPWRDVTAFRNRAVHAVQPCPRGVVKPVQVADVW